ncbi:MAG: NAD-dependent epimerase/dehydratase family protein [Candidatus Melainabacteria bacterium]|nr:NAD-dependent epimerase/dehydratase family protein [Candidatus Melainabacteria bacterium]
MISSSQQTVLVTGASGMIGRAVVDYLCSKGYKVKAQVRSKSKFTATESTNFGPIDLTELDFARATELQLHRLVEGCDAIIHAAALVHQPNAPYEVYELVNVRTTRQLAEIAASAGVDTFVFLSTIAVYGQGPLEDVVECDPIKPMTPYAVSKAQSESWLRSFDRFKRIVVLRPPLVFGEGDRGNMLTLIKQIKKGRYVHIGCQPVKKSVIYSRDLAYAISLCLKDLPNGFNLYNVADLQPVTLRELTETIAKCLGISERFATLPKSVVYWVAQLSELALKEHSPVTRAQIDRLITTTTCSVDKFQQATSFQPAFSLPDSLKAEIAWAELSGFIT